MPLIESIHQAFQVSSESVGAPSKTNRINLFNEFGNKLLQYFIWSMVRTENPPSTFAVLGGINKDNLKSFMKSG